MGAPTLLTRNLTGHFTKRRQERRRMGRVEGRALGSVSEEGAALKSKYWRMDGESGEAGNAGGAVEMSAYKLRPRWVDAAQTVQDTFQEIQAALAHLAKAQQRRLLQVFAEGTSAEKSVETASAKVSSLLAACEERIRVVGTLDHTREVGPREAELQRNAQRGYAARLQQLSQTFRQQQQEHLDELQKRQPGASGDDGSTTISGSSASDAHAFLSGRQVEELELLESGAVQRSEEICRIASSIHDLHTIFKELAVLTIEQGTVLDRIDYNIEQVVDQSQQANQQLQQANNSQKSNRAMKCILILAFINIVLLLILVIKSRH